MVLAPGSRALLLGLPLVLGCGRLEFTPLADAARDGIGGDAAIDAAPTATGPFGGMRAIPALATALTEEEPSFTADRLELYLRIGPPSSDIYVSKRTSATDPWGPPTAVTELNSANEDITPGVAADGLTIWFASDRAAVNDFDIWVSTRPDRSSPWSTPSIVPTLNTGDNELTPWVSVDGQRMYLSSRRVGGNLEIFRAVAASATAWSSAELVAELSHPASEAGPRPYGNERYLVFGSDRASSAQLWSASRASTSEPFGAITPLDEINTIFVENDPWISEDGSYIVFGTNRDGTMDIYEATR